MKKNLLIVAHPDDEVLFFSSVLEYFSQDIHVLCLTDGNADNRGPKRALEFKKAMAFFGIDSFKHESLPDRYDEPLVYRDLKTVIQNNLGDKTERIFTHGPFGEYGNPNHIQDSLVAHELGLKENLKIFSPNVLDLPNASTFYEKDNSAIHLEVWKKKLKVLEEIYQKEYQRFVTLVPPRCRETFLKSDNETLHILQYLVNNHELPQLNAYEPFKASLQLFKEHGLKRVF